MSSRASDKPGLRALPGLRSGFDKPEVPLQQGNTCLWSSPASYSYSVLLTHPDRNTQNERRAVLRFKSTAASFD